MPFINVQRGQSIKWRLALKDANNQPVSLVGASWYVDEGPFGESWRVEPLNLAAGEVWFRVPRAATRVLRPREYVLRLVAAFSEDDAVAFPPLEVRVK